MKLNDILQQQKKEIEKEYLAKQEVINEYVKHLKLDHAEEIAQMEAQLAGLVKILKDPARQ